MGINLRDWRKGPKTSSRVSPATEMADIEAMRPSSPAGRNGQVRRPCSPSPSIGAIARGTAPDTVGLPVAPHRAPRTPRPARAQSASSASRPATPSAGSRRRKNWALAKIHRWRKDPVTRQRVIIISQLSFRLALVITTMGLLWYYLIYFPGQTEYSRARGGPDLEESENGDAYEIKDAKMKDAVILIDVNDVVDSTITTISPAALAQYASNVNTKRDREGDAGFNLQDIVGIDRAQRAEGWGVHAGSLEPTLPGINNSTVRAIYDYQNGVVVDRSAWLRGFDRCATMAACRRRCARNVVKR